MTANERQQVLAYLRKHKDEFASTYGVISIGLFGSVVRDEQSIDSDIDIAIEMDAQKKNMRNFMAFKRHLEEQFGRGIDLGIESSLKDFVRRRIAKEILYV